MAFYGKLTTQQLIEWADEQENEADRLEERNMHEKAQKLRAKALNCITAARNRFESAMLNRSLWERKAN